MRSLKGVQIMNISILSAWQKRLILPFAFSAILPLVAKSYSDESNDGEDRRGSMRENSIVLYDGPLSHDQNWTIKSGPRGPENQVAQRRGGTCSMIAADVSNVSAVERVVFTSERQNLGVWKMSWTDTVSGTASDGNKYKYRQRFDYFGVTSDGRMPRPNRAAPSDEGGGFLQMVPDNVTTDTLNFDDFFLLVTASGEVAASSRIRAVYRQQIPPVSLDPPLAAFPNILLGRFIFSIRDQLAGQAGCDPL
jgi:hypothetical protein